MMKRVIVIVYSTAICLLFVACGGNGTSLESGSASLTASESDSEAELSSAADESEMSKSDIIGDWQISYAINKETGEEVALQSIYGSGLSYGGTLSIKQDGTFSKYIGITNDDTDSYEGTYSISDYAITLEYGNGTVENALYIPDSGSIQLLNNNSNGAVIYEYFVID